MAQGELAVNYRPAGDPLLSALNRAFVRFLAIDPAETLFERRGFPETPARARLESAASAFVAGYNAAIGPTARETVATMLGARPAAERGFLAEGAAMGAAVRTTCLPWRDTLSPLLADLHEHYAHLTHVGVGWALARLPFARRRLMRRLDPTISPLAFDGWGFHDGYFHSDALAAGRLSIGGEAGRIYDQGLGRSLWFSCGADSTRIGVAVASLGEERHPDLWAGIGLACVYAGGSDAPGVDALGRLSGAHIRWLRQGAAFAIGARARAGPVPAEAEATARQICGADAEALTAIVAESLAGAQRNSARQPRLYQEWRRRVADAIEARAA